MTITLTRPRVTGRHRLGRPGLVPVTAMITVIRRGFFLAWLRPARHRATNLGAAPRRGSRAQVPAAA